MKTLLLLAAIIGLTIATPIGNTCAYITDTGVKIYNQAICGTADTEKLLCVLGTCLGTLKNNMCGTSAVCSIGFYAHPTFKICAPCPANCGVCTDGATCTDCYDYFFVNDAKTCTAGPSNCYDPVSATECKSSGCDPGFYLNTNTPPTCSAGPTNCYVPTSATVCTTCKSGFYWNTTTSACAAAGSNCLTADSDIVCTSCANNYWIDIWSTTGKTVCSGPVANCDYIRKPGYCTACSDGYYLSQDTLISTTCKKITITGCKTSTTSTSVCTTCASGYILWKECKSTLSYCKVAASDTTCGTCYEGYALDTTTKLCVFCGVGIKQCASAAGTVSGQSGCKTGWYPSSTNSVCVYCGSRVSVCAAKSASATVFNLAAAKCLTGYVKVSGGTCVSCYSLTASVGTVAAYASCSVDNANAIISATCATNAYASGSTGCIACTGNAATCSASAHTGCLTGYGLSGTTCTTCSGRTVGVTGCTFTGGVEQATTTCVNGVDAGTNYYFDSTTKACYPCTATAAKTCSIKSTTAISCAAGYGFSTLGKGCIACLNSITGIKNCVFAQGDATHSSITCLSGYIIGGSGSSSTCLSCSTSNSGYTGHLADAATCTLSGTVLTPTGCIDGKCLDNASGALSCISEAGVQTGKCSSVTSAGTTTFTITGCAEGYAYRSGQTATGTACTAKTGCAASGTNAGCTYDGTTYTYYTCATGYATSSTSTACGACSTLAAAMSSPPTNNAKWSACKWDSSTSRYIVTACTNTGSDNWAPAVASGDTDCRSCAGVTTGTTSAKLCSSTTTKLIDDDGACAEGYVRSLDLVSCTAKTGYTFYPVIKDVTCSSGYVLNTNTNQCIACSANGGATPAGCTFVAASSTTTSNTCGTGSTLYSTGNYCVSCGSYATGCTLSGATVATITGCQEGYVLKVSGTTYSCEQCSASGGVSTCEYYTISSCLDGYYLDSTTNACTTCTDGNAATCSSTGASLTCATGFSLYSSTCKSCNTGTPYVNVDKCSFDSTGAVSGISSCQSNYYKGPTSTTDTTQTCLQCKTGSATTDSKIATCTYNSASASYPTITACTAGSYLGTNCFAAPSYCTTPVSPGTCSSSGCYTGYYYKDGSCITCGLGASGCTYSSTTGVATITGCITGYYFDSTAKSCSQSAVGCTTWTNSTYCSAAATGYYLKDGSPNSCGTGATACSYASSTVTISACAETYYLSSASPATCEACPTGCKTCSSTGTCSACIGGYFLVGTTCYAATDYCATANQVATCAGCTVNYYWNSTKGSCESCALSGCVHCSAYGVCSVCATGYYLNSGACVACPTTTLGSCVSCSSATTCDQCASGYYWDSTSKACKACATGCNFCAEAATCYECADNYYKNSSNLCSKCNTGCKVCSDSVNCTTCADGYVKVSSTCSACYSACKTCSGTAQNNCLTCPTNSTATSQTISGVTGNSCVCNSGYSWDSTQLKCLAGTGSASYVFVGLLSLLAILFALL